MSGTNTKPKVKLGLKHGLFFAGGALVVGYILILISQAMSNELNSIQLPCGAQSLFTGNQSAECFWGTAFLPLYQLVLFFGVIAIGTGLLIGGGSLFVWYTESAAINRLDQAIAKEPDNPEGYLKRANIWRTRREYAKSLDDYSKAIGLDANNVTAHSYRGAVYIAKEDWRNALADYITVIKLDPHKASAYNARGVVLEKMGEFSKALSDFEKATALEPGASFYRQNLVRLKAKVDIDKSNTRVITGP